MSAHNSLSSRYLEKWLSDCFYIYVAIERYIRLLWATVAEICVSVLMVHNRWTEVAWQPRATVGIGAKTGGEPCGDAVSQAVSLVVSWGVDVLMLMCWCSYVIVRRVIGNPYKSRSTNRIRSLVLFRSDIGRWDTRTLVYPHKLSF